MLRPSQKPDNVEPPLTPGGADLWLLDLDTVEPAVLERYGTLMSDEEHEHERRLRFPGGRERHRCTRALVRTALSHYTGHDPREWVFTTGAHGKPDIAQPAETGLRFNISHSGRMVLCAVTCGAAVGVDVEKIRELPKAVELARRFFAPQEAAAVERASPRQRSREFLRIWTFKESYVKAQGVGLLVPLDGFFFTLSADAAPTIGFADPESDAPENWQFAEVCDAESYQIALAVRRPPATPLSICIRHTVPLLYTTPPEVLSETQPFTVPRKLA